MWYFYFIWKTAEDLKRRPAYGRQGRLMKLEEGKWDGFDR
jgi:hypothetical protein